MKNSKILHSLILTAALSFIGAGLATAAIINIFPSKDNTLYEFDPAEGDVSNALGFHFFAGETAMGELRRGVLAFDIAGSIPPGSTITAVSLSLNMSRTLLETARTVELHKLLADWGEGTSHAPGEEGDGAPATTNDATWRHRFFDTIFWAMQGGDFSATVSASQVVGPVGQYTWSSAQMVADVQSWLSHDCTSATICAELHVYCPTGPTTWLALTVAEKSPPCMAQKMVSKKRCRHVASLVVAGAPSPSSPGA